MSIADAVPTAGRAELPRQLTESRPRNRDRDSLTGLPGRSALLSRLRAAIADVAVGGRGFAVFTVDLDRFADVNTAYGGDVADRLLVAVAARLAAWAGEADYVARVCGDEFVVLRFGVEPGRVAEAARALLAIVATPVDVGTHRIHVTATVGALAAAVPCNADQLLASAAAARVHGKRAGGARVVLFDPAMTQTARTRVEFANDLGRALDDDEISLHYQPIVDLASGALVGLEALLRWDHPERGPIAPGQFVELAEQTGLAVDLDAWVLRRACTDAARLRDRGILGGEGYVSVNLSPHTLAAGEVRQLLTSALATSALAARNLLVEVKEAGLLSTDGVFEAVEVLQRLGVGVSLDAFGAGGATLADLRSFAFATLKIDRSFVQAMSESADALTVVASGIELARGLGAGAVAMGVETERQATMLRHLGCDSGQGYLWSEPIPLPQVARGLQGSRFGGPTWVGGTTDVDEITAEHGLLRIVALHQSGASPASIAAALNREDYRSPQGQRWHARTVEVALRRLDSYIVTS
jgi:diguanylate cyclase (GGDEF)-like protein